MGFLSEFYFKFKLKSLVRHRQVEHDFLSISLVKHVIVALQCDDYLSFRHIEKEIRLLLIDIPQVSIIVYVKNGKADDLNYVVNHKDILISKKDLKMKLVPSDELIAKVDQIRADVFVNLEKEKASVIDFLTEVSNANMRIGFEEKKAICDLMINGKGKKDLASFFNKIKEVLERIIA